AIAAEAGVPVSGHGRDRPVDAYSADALVTLVRYEEISAAIDRHASGVEARAARRSSITAEAVVPVSGHGRDRPVDVYSADALVLLVRYEEISAAIHGHASRVVDCRTGRRSAIAAEAVFFRVPGHGRQLARRIDLEDGKTPSCNI